MKMKTKKNSHIANGVDEVEEDSHIANGVCTESKSDVAPMILWNLKDSSIDLDNARSSDSDSNYTYNSGTFKT
eukprot:12283677-Ditylum_brightwellii.AAC.1